MDLVRLCSDRPEDFNQGRTKAGNEGDAGTGTEREINAESEAHSIPAIAEAVANLDLGELGEACPECLNLDPVHVVLGRPGGWYKNETEDVISFSNDWLHFLSAEDAGECSVCPILVDILSFYGLDRGTDDEEELDTRIEVRLPRSGQGNTELVFDGVSGDSIVVQVYVCMSSRA